ncbi:MAG: tetratricopeptide repeat protein [Terriglobales bacterium]
MGAPLEPGTTSQLRQARNDTIALSVLIAVVVVGFAVTAWLVRRYDAERAARAWNWQKSGAAALRQKHPRQAAEAYRNALAYNGENAGYQFGLGTALYQSGQLAQASRYFLALWRRAPQSGPVNLSLARLEARENYTDAAVRYYHNAIYGIWPAGGGGQRQTARRELIALLLRNGQATQADAEILALGATLPPTAAAHAATGQQLLEVGDNHHALEEFQAALRQDPHRFAALVGAGRAAFRLAEYLRAQAYLRQAARLRPHNIVAGPLLATTEQVLALDPFAFGLSRPEREQRVRRDVGIARARLRRCQPAAEAASGGSGAPAAAKPTGGGGAGAAGASAAAAPLAALAATGQKLQQRIARRKLFQDPDGVSKAMSFVFQAEQAGSNTCGAPSGSDLALLLIARQRGGQ